MTLSAHLISEFEELVARYPKRQAGLIPALHRCQEENGGWISPEIMEDCAEFFDLEPVEVWGVVSFYPMFRIARPGRHLIHICHNVSCDLRGARELVSQVCALTGAELHGTSPDGKFTVETVECQGLCANAPMFEIGGAVYEDLDLDKARRILEELP